MKHLPVYQDASLHHVHTKLLAYFIACVLLGIVLSVVFPDFNDDDKINRTRRNARPVPTRLNVRSMRTLRSTRRKAA